MADPQEAVEFMRAVQDAESANRTEALQDLRFRWGDQWPQYAIQARGQERPQLTINETDSYIRKVTNSQRQQRPRVKVHPVDSIADPQIARVITGLTRHIEVNSDADNAYDTAFNFAATMGWGYWRVRTDYCREDSFNQDIFIDTIENPFTVYFDHFSKLPDGSDAEKVLITDLMRKTAFEKEFPGAQTSGEFPAGSSGDMTNWVTNDEIRIAEYIYIDRKKAKLVMLSDGTVVWADQLPSADIMAGAGITVKGDRESFKRVVRWCKLTAFETLEEKVLPGRYIPVVPVYGDQMVIDGKRERKGLVRDAKDPARMNNFWYTSTTESIALAPKAKWLVPEGATEGHENEWNRANVSALPVLTWKTKDEQGRDLPPPIRQQPEPPPQGAIIAMQMSSNALQRVLGIYEPAVRQGAQHKSDDVITTERGESDIANYHLYDNLTRSIKHTGRIILDLIPKIYDVQRVTRIIGEDERPKMVTLNEKQMDPTTQAIVKVMNDVTVGEYDVVMDTGPGYETKRQEGTRAALELMGTPLGEKVAATADDLIVRNMDFPGADAIADRLAAANPLASIDENIDVPPQVQMVVQGLKGQLQQAQQIIQQLEIDKKYRLDSVRIKEEGDTRRELMRQTGDAHEREITRAQKQHDTETYALTAQNVAEINAIARILTSNGDHAHELRATLAKFDHERDMMDRQQQAQAETDEPVGTVQ